MSNNIIVSLSPLLSEQGLSVCSGERDGGGVRSHNSAGRSGWYRLLLILTQPWEQRQQWPPWPSTGHHTKYFPLAKSFSLKIMDTSLVVMIVIWWRGYYDIERDGGWIFSGQPVVNPDWSQSEVRWCLMMPGVSWVSTVQSSVCPPWCHLTNCPPLPPPLSPLDVIIKFRSAGSQGRARCSPPVK